MWLSGYAVAPSRHVQGSVGKLNNPDVKIVVTLETTLKSCRRIIPRDKMSVSCFRAVRARDP